MITIPHRRKRCRVPVAGAASPKIKTCKWCGQRWELVLFVGRGWRYVRAERIAS